MSCLCCKPFELDPIDYKVSTKQLSLLFYDRNMDHFDVDIGEEHFSFQRTISIDKGTIYAFSCDPSYRNHAILLRSIFQGDVITVCSSNAEFLQNVAQTLYIKDLGTIASSFTENGYIDTSCKSFWYIFWYSFVSFFSHLGIFGKILIFLWDLTGFAFVVAFFINVVVLLSTMGVYLLSSNMAAFIFVLLPLMLYSMFFVNIIAIAVNDLTALKIFYEKTLWSHHQILIKKLFKVYGWVKPSSGDYFIPPGSYHDFFKGIIFCVFIVLFLYQAFSEEASNIVGYFIMVFAVVISPIKHGLLIPIYTFHGFASCFKSCRNRYRELGDFSDPFLNSIYFRPRPYYELFKCCFSSEKNHDQDEVSIQSVDSMSELNDEKEEETKLQSSGFRVFLRALFSRETYSIFVIVALLLYLWIKFSKSSLKVSQAVYVIVIFDMLIIPLCMWMPMPFYWISRNHSKPITENELKLQHDELRTTKKYHEYNNNLMIWGGEYSKIRWISLLVSSLIFSLLFMSVFVAQNYQSFVQRSNVNITKTPKVKSLMDSGDAFRLITNSICYARPKDMSMLELIALTEAAYFAKNETEGLDVVMSEFFGNDWNTTIDVIDTTANGTTFMGAIRHFKIKDRNLVVFAIRGTYSAMDALADAELWFGSFVLDAVLPFVPLLEMYASDSRSYLGSLMSIPRYIFPQFSLIDGYVKQYETYIKSIKINSDEDVLIVGHSLGGGLSKILSLRTGYQAVAVSGPGIRAVQGFYKSDFEGIENSFVNINPQQDYVAILDTPTGSEFQVPCSSGFIKCHASTRTLCMVSIMCGEYDTHRGYCQQLYENTTLDSMIELGSPTNISLR